MIKVSGRSTKRPPASPDYRALREAEKILLAELESAMEEYRKCRRWEVCGKNAQSPSDGPCKRSVVAMRRLGNFLKTREIPEDIKAKISNGS